jgi:hypothetical protein
MRGGIDGADRLIERARDDAVVDDEHGADGDFAGGESRRACSSAACIISSWVITEDRRPDLGLARKKRVRRVVQLRRIRIGKLVEECVERG